MPEGRAKKAKKTRWQLTLGMKQVICGGLGLTWVMLIIFILGVMAGRGDIYRWFSSWGLITPEAPKIAQWSPPPAPPPVAPANSPPTAPVAAAPTALPSTPSTPAASPPPVTGSIASALPPASDSRTKKAKKGVSQQEARDKELQRLRQEVAAKLKFQNSFDSKPPKTARMAPKKKEKTPVAGQKAQSQPVRVAQFRDLKGAKAKMAELQKKGEKVALKKGKDKKGVFYEIVREAPAKAQPADALAQKTQKPSGSKPKKQTETRN